jgi:hypothetical protein
MVCKMDTGDLYWFGPRNVLRPLRGESSVLSCTEVLVVGVTIGHERGGVPKSHGISGEGGRGGVCDSAGYLARSGRVAYLYLALCCYGGSVELSSTSPLE